MDYHQEHYVRVRYRDTKGRVSPWSVAKRFVTEEEPRIAQPLITSPINGSIATKRDLQLSSSEFTLINAVDTHDSTDWEVATDSAFTNVIFQSLSDAINLTSITPSGLNYETTYYARVRYRGETLNPSLWSDTVSFTTELEPRVIAPTLLSPEDEATNQNVSLLVTTSDFQTVNSDDTHQSTDWQIATSVDFDLQSMVEEDLNNTTALTERLFSGLMYNTTYYVRARHKGVVLDASPWSFPISFSTKIQPIVAIPSVVLPTTGAQDQALTVEASSSAFTMVSGIDTHTSSSWELSTDSGFSSVVRSSYDDEVNKTSWTISELNYDTVYYLRVKYSGAESGETAWSLPINFKTELEPALVTPSVTSPSDDSTGLAIEVTITTSAFSKINTPDTHSQTHWQIATDDTFSTLLVDEQDAVNLTGIQITGLSYDTEYYVRVRHQGSVLGWTTWSGIINFRTEIEPVIATPSIQLPANGSVWQDIDGVSVVSSSFVMQTGLDTHEETTWQFSEDPLFETTYVNQRSTQDLTAINFIPEAYGKTYYVRVRHHGSKSDSLWSAASSFSIEPQPSIVTPSITSPSHLATGQQVNLTLSTSAFDTVNSSDTHTKTQWRVSLSSDLSNPILDEESATDLLSKEVSGLNYNTLYYVGVRHQGSLIGWSEWSAVSRFTTKAKPVLATPSITSPSNGASGVSTSVTVTSSEASYTTGTDTHAESNWQFASVSDFSVLYSDTNYTDERKTSLPVNLPYNVPVYVRVRYRGNEADWSTWSTAVAFTTEQQPRIVTPSVTSPADGAGNQELSVTITTSAFAKVNTPDTHSQTHWQIATDDSFTNLVLDSASATDLTSRAVSGLNYWTNYYVRVRHQGSVLGWSDWSATSTFGTRIQPIVAQPTITSPTNGAQNMELDLTLQCTPFTLTQGTDTRASTTWQIATDASFNNIVAQTTY